MNKLVPSTKKPDQILLNAIEGFKYELEKLQNFKSETIEVFKVEEGRKLIRYYKEELKRAINNLFKQFEEKFEQAATTYTESLEANIDEIERRLELVISNLERARFTITNSPNEASEPNKLFDIDFDHEIRGYNSLVTDIMKTKVEIVVDTSPFEDLSERFSRFLQLSQKDGKQSVIQPTGILETFFENASNTIISTGVHPLQQNKFNQSTGISSDASSKTASKLTPVSDFEVDLPNYFKDSSPLQVLHFFEGNSKKLHLLDLHTLIGKSQKNSPSFKVIELKIDFKIPIRHRSIITPQGKIYLTGGVEHNRTTNLTMRYVPETCKLELMKPMIYPRKSHGMCYLNGFIYCIGGFTEIEGFTNHCERYDILSGNWEAIKRMNHKSSSPSVCTFGKDTIFRFGGLRSVGQIAESIEKYDVVQDKWTAYDVSSEVLGLKIQWLSASCQINRNQILVVGGFDENDNASTQSFLFEVSEFKEKDDAAFKIKKINPSGLPFSGGFWNHQGIVHSEKLYLLQNYDSPTNKTTSDESRRRILQFGGGNGWEVL